MESSMKEIDSLERLFERMGTPIIAHKKLKNHTGVKVTFVDGSDKTYTYRELYVLTRKMEDERSSN
jgi:hypothetical protein